MNRDGEIEGFTYRRRRCGNQAREDWQILTLKIRVMWSQAKERQGHQKWKLVRHRFSPRTSGGSRTLLTSGFQYSDTQFGLLSSELGGINIGFNFATTFVIYYSQDLLHAHMEIIESPSYKLF